MLVILTGKTFFFLPKYLMGLVCLRIFFGWLSGDSRVVSFHLCRLFRYILRKIMQKIADNITIPLY